MTAIFKRELKSYFSSMTGYMFCAFMTFFIGLYTMAINIDGLSTGFEFAISNMSFIYIIIIPILTMRVISEERKQRTDTLLYSLPVSMTEVVLAKYFAMIVVLFAATVIIGIYPLVLSLYGSLNFATIYSTLFAFFLLGAALIAMGLFASALTENQAISAAMAFLIVLVNYFIPSISLYLSPTAKSSLIALGVAVLVLSLIIYFVTKDYVTGGSFGIIALGALAIIYIKKPEMLAGLFPAIVEKLSLFSRFEAFPNGIFDITAIIYFIVVCTVFVFLTVQVMEKRRWS